MDLRVSGGYFEVTNKDILIRFLGGMIMIDDGIDEDGFNFLVLEFHFFLGEECSQRLFNIEEMVLVHIGG